MTRDLRWMVRGILIAVLIAAWGVSSAPQESNAPPSGQTGVRLPGGRRGRPNEPAPAGTGGAPQQQAAPRGRAPATPVPPGAAATSPKSPPTVLDIVRGEGGVEEMGMEWFALDIDHVLRLLMQAAHVTILKDQDVSGPFTIICPDKVPIDVAFQIVNSALEMRGFTMWKTDLGLYKVEPIARAAQSGPPVRFGNRPEEVPAGDQIITQVIPLRNLQASDMAAEMRPLMSDQARVVATSTNSIIITDTASNVSRVMTLIADMESQLSGGYTVFYLQYKDATEMADLVNGIVLSRASVSGAGARPAWEQRVVGAATATGARAAARPQAASVSAGAGPEFCYPDARTNSLIVLATPTHVQQIGDLVEQLDRPVSLRDTYFIYPVQNLVASELAQLVGPAVNANVQTLSGAGATGTARRTTSATGATTGQGSRAGTRTSGGFQSGSIRLESVTPGEGDRTEGSRERVGEPTALELEPLAGESAPRPSVESLAGQPLMVAQAPGGGVLPPGFPGQPMPVEGPVTGEAPGGEEVYSPGTYGQATIIADDNTNVLLISAPPEQLDLIKQLLEKLDVLPPQVHIQAIIAEVTLTRDTSLGFQWEGLKALYQPIAGLSDRNWTGAFGQNFSLIGTDDKGNPLTPTGFTGIIAGPEDFQAVITALTSDTHARILSTPGVFTTSGKEAQIDVSSRRPFPRGILTSTTAGSAISTALDWESVGIVLTVTPRVTTGDVVQMDVQVSADEPGSPVKIAGQEYPSTQARRVNANGISVKSGHTVILGGLMRDTITRSASRVPLLGQLPIIGSLFSSTSSKRQKSELLVFLTPRVVRTPGEAAQLTEDQKARLPEVPRSLQKPADGSEAQK